MKSISAKRKSSAREARLVIEASLNGASPATLRCYMRFLDASMRFLSSTYGDRWGVTLFDDGIRLNAGWTEVLVLGRGCVNVLVDKDIAPAGTKMFVNSYDSAPGCGLTKVPLSALTQILPSLSEAHHSAISIAARRKTTKYIREAHSGGVTRFVSEYLRHPVPDPSYCVPQPVGRDFLVLWRYDEAIRVNGHVMTGARGTHAGGLGKGDRMFVAATQKDELYLLGAMEVERSGKDWSSGTSIFGAFQILPLRAAKWKLSFESSNAPKLSKAHSLAWQVRSRRLLTPASVLMLERLLEKGATQQRKRLAAREGKLKELTLLKRERDPKVRASALAERGTECEACGFDFETVYGEFAKHCVEVHHLRILAEAKDSGIVTSMEDVRVLCPNCHRALHRSSKPKDWNAFKTLSGRK